METLAQQRQRFHRLLLQTGEAEHKAEIINSFFSGYHKYQATKSIPNACIDNRC